MHKIRGYGYSLDWLWGDGDLVGDWGLIWPKIVILIGCLAITLGLVGNYRRKCMVAG